MKETYLSRDFRETAAQRFPARAKALNAAFDARLKGLLAENANASKEKLYHLKRQILPGIAAYETLQTVMPKEQAAQGRLQSGETLTPEETSYNAEIRRLKGRIEELTRHKEAAYVGWEFEGGTVEINREANRLQSYFEGSRMPLCATS